MKRFPPVPDEVKARLLEYKRVHGGWGSLHMVLSGRNVKDSNILWTVQHCIRCDDHEARWLAKHLLVLSTTQRIRMCYL